MSVCFCPKFQGGGGEGGGGRNFTPPSPHTHTHTHFSKRILKNATQIRVNTYIFSNHDNNRFISLLQKGVYPYEYMDDWTKFNETFLPEIKRFL